VAAVASASVAEPVAGERDGICAARRRLVFWRETIV
jgi:hypothetical protein